MILLIPGKYIGSYPTGVDWFGVIVPTPDIIPHEKPGRYSETSSSHAIPACLTTWNGYSVAAD